MKLVHFSDVHVQLPRWRERSLRELGPLRALATVELWKGRGKDYDGAVDALRRIAALEADHFVCTGDLTQLGHPEEFALAREALAPIRDRLTLFHGNHDRYPIGGMPNRLFEESFGVQPEVKVLPGLALISVDSCGEVCWPVISRGRVRAPQLDALCRALASQQDRCKLVLIHHAPTRRGGKQDWPWHDLRGAARFLEVCADGGADAVLCGHIHDRFDEPPARGRPRVICAGSSTERGDEGYWLLHVEGRRLVRAERGELG